MRALLKVLALLVTKYVDPDSPRGIDALGSLRPTLEPRATQHIAQMLAMIGRLIEKGYAYAAGGDVYFDISEFAGHF